jgi:hypothetical protein
MARLHVADRGDGLQIWRVAANILNKQSRTVDRGWHSSLGVGRGTNNPHRKTLYLLRSMYKDLGNGRILWCDPSTGKMGKPQGKRPLGRPRRRWEDGIRMDLTEIGLGSVDWIQLAQDRDRWRALVNTVMNLRVLAPRN